VRRMIALCSHPRRTFWSIDYFQMVIMQCCWAVERKLLLDPSISSVFIHNQWSELLEVTLDISIENWNSKDHAITV
jgi:hypothetical protein